MPTVGRLVYYKTRGSLDGVFKPNNVAAIIVAVNDIEKEYVSVKLCVFNPTGIYFTDWISQGREPGQWEYIADDVPSGKLDKCIGSNDTMDTLHKPDQLPYIIVSSDIMDELEDKVCELINAGYIPSGAPQLSRNDSDDNDRHYQAMCLLSIYQPNL